MKPAVHVKKKNTNTPELKLFCMGEWANMLWVEVHHWLTVTRNDQLQSILHNRVIPNTKRKCSQIFAIHRYVILNDKVFICLIGFSLPTLRIYVYFVTLCSAGDATTIALECAPTQTCLTASMWNLVQFGRTITNFVLIWAWQRTKMHETQFCT